MFPWNPQLWTEDYLLSLRGQPESSCLEYKSGKALLRKEDKANFVKEHLSPTVSAFANSEGGIIIVGITEDREITPRVAKELDGIIVGKGEAIESSEQFQQIVDSCINPYLAGMRVKRIALSGSFTGRSAFVIYVPQGITAYQAKDHLYYSRSEFETKSMPDHEIRFRMLRGRVAQASVDVVNCVILTANEEWTKRQKALHDIELERDAGEMVFWGRQSREAIEAPKRIYDEYSFQLRITNSGETTIRDFLLSIRFKTSLKVFRQGEGGRDLKTGIHSDSEVESGSECRYRFLAAERQTTSYRPEKKIFPRDRELFPRGTWLFHLPDGGLIKPDDIVLIWTVYLDDAPSSFGEIDLAGHFQHQASALYDA